VEAGTEISRTDVLTGIARTLRKLEVLYDTLAR
jgi:hypothetical protein